jgi:hypothetical protein
MNAFTHIISNSSFASPQHRASSLAPSSISFSNFCISALLIFKTSGELTLSICASSSLILNDALFSAVRWLRPMANGLCMQKARLFYKRIASAGFSSS